jgi:hypothetical protein
VYSVTVLLQSTTEKIALSSIGNPVPTTVPDIPPLMPVADGVIDWTAVKGTDTEDSAETSAYPILAI